MRPAFYWVIIYSASQQLLRWFRRDRLAGAVCLFGLVGYAWGDVPGQRSLDFVVIRTGGYSPSDQGEFAEIRVVEVAEHIPVRNSPSHDDSRIVRHNKLHISFTYRLLRDDRGVGGVSNVRSDVDARWSLEVAFGRSAGQALEEFVRLGDCRLAKPNSSIYTLINRRRFAIIDEHHIPFY